MGRTNAEAPIVWPPDAKSQLIGKHCDAGRGWGQEEKGTKYWSFSFIISPSKENSGLISFRIDWFDLLAVQGTLNNFLQNHSSKASVLQYSAFFMVQPSHWYMTTGKTIGLTTWTLLVK